MERFFNLDGSNFWIFLTGPVLTALIWFVLDYSLRKLYEKTSIVDKLFSGKTHSKGIKRAVLMALRLVIGVYFSFILLSPFGIDSKPLINVQGDNLWKTLSGPTLTVAIWIAFDYGMRKLYEKSSFIERIFSGYSRIKTFKGLLLQAGRVLLGIYFAFILLDHFSIDPKPLLAGIGVVGLGLSLAAQNILRDFINGLFIIIEDQFNVGDWVTIGDNSGTVEHFTMRVTRLRATDGRLIIIPNGNITEVANSTKDFAIALVEVGVSYKSDVRKVLEILEECAAETAAAMPGVVVEEAKIYGILAFRESDVLIRVTAKTIPGEQWAVERNMRIIIKENFDRLGIDIPLRQVVVHTEDKSAPEAVQSIKSSSDTAINIIPPTIP
ncbi:MAG: mechanosensitive ion channel family protein [Synergistaceae bacterium]|jgi:small conductance mechanosensitive channel|nr:mechanosensitive ion channel family protein [Synergistaceae bacterium]